MGAVAFDFGSPGQRKGGPLQSKTMVKGFRGRKLENGTTKRQGRRDWFGDGKTRRTEKNSTAAGRTIFLSKASKGKEVAW